MLCNGFSLTTGQAQFPTFLDIQLVEFNESTGKLHVKGKMRDNDDD